MKIKTILIVGITTALISACGGSSDPMLTPEQIAQQAAREVMTQHARRLYDVQITLWQRLKDTPSGDLRRIPLVDEWNVTAAELKPIVAAACGDADVSSASWQQCMAQGRFFSAVQTY